MKTTFYKFIIAIALVSTIFLARYELSTIKTFSGLTLLPFVFLIVVFVGIGIAKDIKEMWQAADEDDEDAEA